MTTQGKLIKKRISGLVCPYLDEVGRGSLKGHYFVLQIGRYLVTADVTDLI